MPAFWVVNFVVDVLLILSDGTMNILIFFLSTGKFLKDSVLI